MRCVCDRYILSQAVIYTQSSPPSVNFEHVLNILKSLPVALIFWSVPVCPLDSTKRWFKVPKLRPLIYFNLLLININMATSPMEEVSSEDEIFFGKITMKEIRARFLPKVKRRALRHANRKKDLEINGSDASIKIIEMLSEPEMNIQNDWTDSSYGTTSSNKADSDIKIDEENSYLRILPDDSFLRLEKQVADCSISGDIFQNHTLGMKFCFDPPLNKQPIADMIVDENVKQIAKTEQSHSFCNNNRDGLFKVEQDCKPIIQAQDDTPPDKHNPPTEENTNQVTLDVPRHHESAKSERTLLKNNNFLETPVTELLSMQRQNANNSDILKTPNNTLANENEKQVAKTEQSHSFCNNNRDGLCQLEQDCKPIIQTQDDTPPYKHNLPTEENKNQVTPDVSRHHESAKSERTPLKNNNFLETPATEVISTPRENANKTDIFKTPKNTLSKKQQASTVTKSLRKVNTYYQHVASPVALYIKRSPQASLAHSVNPKPLPISHIPKLIKNPVKKNCYKENTPLRRTVYQNPKETIVLTSNRKKISKDQHSKITDSTVVIRKHAPNEGNLKKEIVFQDDTINESLISQPDFSIHIENSTLY